MIRFAFLAALAASTALADSVVFSTEQFSRCVWCRPNDWMPTVEVVCSPASVETVNFETNKLCMVYSNSIERLTYSLQAKLGMKQLDEIDMANIGAITWSAMNGGAISGDTFTATTAGCYRVRGESPNGSIRYADVLLTYRRGDETAVSTYVSDAADGDSLRKTVNDGFLADLQAATFRGTNRADGAVYGIWECRRCPAAQHSGFTCAGYRLRNALSPHLLIGARHYGANQMDCYPAFEDPTNGTVSAVHSRGLCTGANGYDPIPQYLPGYGFPLAQWALTNGFTRAEVEAMNIEDVAIYPVQGTALVPTNCCPWFMSMDAVRRHFGGGHIGAWHYTQSNWSRGASACNWVVPCILRIKNGTLGDEDLQCASGWANASSAWPKDWTRTDILARRDAMIATAGAPFVRTYGGDSSGGIWVRVGDRWVMMSTFHSASSGPSLCAAVPVLRRLCAMYGDTLKEIE